MQEKPIVRNQVASESYAEHIADLYAKLKRNKAHRMEALRNPKNEDYITAHRDIGMFHEKIGKAMFSLATRENDAQKRALAIHHIEQAFRHYGISGWPKPGLADMTNKERAAIVEENKKIFYMTRLRRKNFDEIQQLKGKLKHYEKKDPRTAARLHSGIRNRLLVNSYLTDALGDAGKAGTPKMAELNALQNEHKAEMFRFRKEAAAMSGKRKPRKH